MDPYLLVLGIAKAFLGVVVAVAGVWLATRLLSHLLGLPQIGPALKEGNLAVAVVEAGSLVAMGMLAQKGVYTSFSALDLVFAQGPVDAGALFAVGSYVLVQVVVALALGTATIGVGVRLFVAMTSHIDEMAEIQAGNLAVAIGLAAMIVVLAILVSPGVEGILDGLLPWPELGLRQQ